jgi:predicted nucleic acid-binding protein
VQREDPTLFSSDLLRTEALRAARRYSVEAHRLARRRLAALTLLSLTADISERAGDLDPAILGSLDALHLASALSLAEELEGILTHLRRAAGRGGWPAWSRSRGAHWRVRASETRVLSIVPAERRHRKRQG